MNIEMFFVRSDRRNDLWKIILNRLQSPPDPPGKQPDWRLPSSYDSLLAVLSKRKIAISPIQNGWIAVVESKEVLDYGLLRSISEILHTDVIAVILSEVTGSCGYALGRKGTLVEHYFSDEDPAPAETVKKYLIKNSIQHQLVVFREATQLKSLGWDIVDNRYQP